MAAAVVKRGGALRPAEGEGEATLLEEGRVAVRWGGGVCWLSSVRTIRSGPAGEPIRGEGEGWGLERGAGKGGGFGGGGGNGEDGAGEAIGN